MAYWPFAQHESWGPAECERAVVGQSGNIRDEVVAKAAKEPCKPMASINMRTMNWRCML